MNCKDYREELMLYFGQEELPAELYKHIAGCEACHAFYEEMKRMATKIGEDVDFYPNDLEVEGLLSRVNNGINKTQPVRVTSLSWYKLVGVAATIILVVGISMFSNLFKQTGSTAVDSIELSSALIFDDDDQLSDEVSEYYELNDAQFYILVDDFTSSRTYDAAGQLLDDLSEEELKYLEENFKVGDLL